MTKKQAQIIDGDHTGEGRLCGHALIGNDVGTCPDCHNKKALMASGYCATCATKRGIDVFNTKPNPRKQRSTEPKK